MSIGLNSTLIGAALLALYWGLAVVMHSLGADIPYPTDFLPHGWRW